MRFNFRLPRFFASTVETGPARPQPVTDGKDVNIPNAWKLGPNTVAFVGRPAVWFSLDLTTPRIPLGFVTLPSRRLVWEQDFGGHLFITITGPDAATAVLVEAGPLNRNGTGPLVPFGYPEDNFAKRGIVDFEPVPIAPPHGLSEDDFADLVRATHRAYDGDQRYIAVELPFVRIGRDSNSYVVGVLLACGLDMHAIPKPKKEMRWEWTGYPGAEDPVHAANFGVYLGAPTKLAGGAVDVAYHNEDGSLRYVVVGGERAGSARLPDGTDVSLDALGRILFTPADARRHGLPSTHTEPPESIRQRRRFPPDPAPAGAFITLVVDGRSVPLEPGKSFRGVVIAREDALDLATLRTKSGSEVVLPLVELGVELRDPQRVDRLFRVGREVTVGLRRDRHPKLVTHGFANLADRVRFRRFHWPRPVNIRTTAAIAVLSLGAIIVWWRSRA